MRVRPLCHWAEAQSNAQELEEVKAKAKELEQELITRVAGELRGTRVFLIRSSHHLILNISPHTTVFLPDLISQW